MKKSILFLTTLLMVSFISTGQVNKARVQSNIANPEIKSFYDGAVEVYAQKATTMSELKINKRMRRSDGQQNSQHYHDIVFKRGYALAGKVKRAGSNMSAVKYARFQRELESIETEMNTIAGSGTTAAGDPAPGTLGECWKSCNDAVGEGWGGGKGWNRFACKTGCIITKLPPGN